MGSIHEPHTCDGLTYTWHIARVITNSANREFPEKYESTTLGRDGLSREIGSDLVLRLPGRPPARPFFIAQVPARSAVSLVNGGRRSGNPGRA